MMALTAANRTRGPRLSVWLPTAQPPTSLSPAPSLACHGLVDSVPHLRLEQLADVGGLQFRTDAVQEALEEVLGGGVHHLALDRAAVGRPVCQKHDSVAHQHGIAAQRASRHVRGTMHKCTTVRWTMLAHTVDDPCSHVVDMCECLQLVVGMFRATGILQC